MSVDSQKIFKYAFGVMFALLFIFVTEQLFLDGYGTGEMWESILKNFSNKNVQSDPILDDLRIVYPDEPSSVEPTLLDPATRQRISNVYDSLVKNDKDYKIRTDLAVNWGLLDDTTWEFRLRPDVKFHDGSDFDSEDVASSIKRAMTKKDSQLIEILNTIESVQVVDRLNVRIKTYKPDPVLLNKLALVLILPSEQNDKEIMTPVGTGPYKFQEWIKGDKIVFEKFDEYWGDTKPKFNKVEVFVKTKKNDRVKMFLNGDADFLAFVPYDAVDIVKEKGFSVTTVPSLEVQFIGFNFSSKLLSNVENRKVVSLVIDQDALVKTVGGYARPSSQFVSDGIYGFNSAVSAHEFNLDKAKQIAEKNGLVGQTLLLSLPKGLDVLGNNIKDNLEKIGVYTVVSYLESDDFINSLKGGKSDMYFLAFKSDIGDASNFLDQVSYSKGSSNFGNYKNDNVDVLVDESKTEMDPATRRGQLQKAMKIVASDDIFGVPLFEYENVYSFVSKIEITPRIDGLIYFDDINLK